MESTWKIHLIHTFKKLLEKNFTGYIGSAEKFKVLLLSPTRVSAININGTTIHSALNIPINCRSRNLPKLSDSKCYKLRNLLNEIQVVTFDEISVVSKISFLHIYQHLCETFGCIYGKAFARKTVLVVGDLLGICSVCGSRLKCVN